MKTRVPCKLCGLPVKTCQDPSKDFFCCNGCKMVHTMLMESDQYKDTQDFKDTDLYKQCVAAGIIPDTSEKNPTSGEQDPGAVTQDSSRPKDSSGTVGKLPIDSDNLLTLNFQIQNMWCPACAWVVENTLTRSKGVINASCNFSSDRGSVLYDPVKTSPEKVYTAIKKLGYPCADLDQAPQKNKKEFIRLCVTLFLTMNVMMLSWAIYSGFFIELSRHSVQLLAWPVFLMATVVVFYGGYPIHKRALGNITSGWPGMETLISTGSFSTYSYSLFHFYKGSIHLYFDAASMLILLILTGKMLEQSAKNKISEGLAGFFSLVPQKVRICAAQFPKGRYVSIKQLSQGDSFMAEQGEILAADGIVTKGAAVIDESSITGEAKPVSVSLEDAVKSGTRIISGKIQVKAVRVGEDSILGRMLAIMENSLSEKTAQTQRLENLLKFFVPGVMGLSVLTFFFWMINDLSAYEAFNRGISVLVISCPCALGIAIPLALVAGVSAAGKKGILVRNFEAFEKVEGLDTIAFDKTGTLTTGKLDVLDMDTAMDFPDKKAWQIVLAMEQGSDHYIAHTIKAYGIQQDLAPLELENVVYHANGVSCRFQDKPYRFGSMAFVQTDGSPAPSFISPSRKGAQIISTVFLSADGTIVAAVHLGDSMKKDVKSLVARLGKMGFTSFLISGDAPATTLAAGAFVHIPAQCIHGGLLPHEKADFIRGLRQSGKKIAMVGDGVNDAPAMAQSDIAIAVHSGLNPGEGVAAITLMQETPVQLLEFIRLAKRVNGKVKQNLLFALVYNLISIPVAASGLLNPIIAATAMLMSSLSVTFNTLLLVKRESKIKTQAMSLKE
ncbi:cation-translocating P-type ATPase [Desulfobacula sp.]|uniref:heavy metal translocating P-type ATPase n=1 Tax=Desulfobacula sp. TaxID=2593537 RepID=UPI0026065F7D|nr:cation-translocating P-type ATPase [Desulfobacula sp.]